MHPQDRQAPVEVGRVEHDLAVEATGAQQRAVEHVGPVGRGEQDHARVGLEAVDLDSSWLSVCSRSSLTTPRCTPRWRPIASISSMNTMHGALRLRLLEQVAHARGSDADEHLDEVAAR